jgi:hypothetical protein
MKLTLLTTKYEMVIGLWNTILFGNSILSTPGEGVGGYIAKEKPQYSLDQNNNTKYLSFGNCNRSDLTLYCGLDTGFHVTLQQGATLLTAFQLTTAGDFPDRDPLGVTIEGSNATDSALSSGTSWSLIFSGSTGLEKNIGRGADGLIQCIPNNVVWYTSYRVLVTSKRGSSNSVQYSEVRLLGQENPSKGKLFLFRICCLPIRIFMSIFYFFDEHCISSRT